VSRRTRCFEIVVDGESCAILGDPDMSPEATAALRDLVRAARARMEAEETPELAVRREAGRERLAALRRRAGVDAPDRP
jgi:hypothetical protein